MRRTSTFLLATILAAGSAFAAGVPPRVSTLANGLTVVLAPDSGARSVDVAMWFRAGTRYEATGASGLTSLFGSLYFAGSKGHPAGDHRRLIEARGGAVSSVTNPDYTCFYETVPPAALDLALELEADRLQSLVLTEPWFRATRDAAAEEQRRRLEGSPLALGVQRLYATAFQGHPYARPAIGLLGELGRVTFADAEGYWRARFAPQNALLTVVGRFDPEPTLATIRRAFEKAARRPAPAPSAASFTPQSAERRDRAFAPTENSVLLVGWRGPGSADPDSPAMDAVAEMVTGGVASRLKAIQARRTDLIQVQGEFDRSRDASLLFGMAAVMVAADTTKAEEALIATVEALGKEPVAEEELEHAKRQLEARALFSWQTPRGRAEDIGSAQILDGDARRADDRLERIRRLTAADVQRVAARWLKAENRSVVWVLPVATARGAR